MTVCNAWCAFGLGSNLGDRAALLHAALQALGAVPGLELLGSAPLQETEPVDCPEGSPAFLNTAAHGHYTGDLLELLAHTQAIEKQLGRTPDGPRNAARPLDIDILLVAGVTLESPALTLPHPRMHERLFVLRPLADLCPDLILPDQRPIGQAMESLQGP